MRHRATPIPPVDERLESLLATERRLEARVRDAERAAGERVAAAREAAAGESLRRGEAIEAEAREEDDAERARADAELRRVEVRAAALAARLAAVPDDEIERLARLVYGRVARDEGPP